MRPVFCQGCCRQSPLRQVRFRRNQGFLVFYVAFHAEGYLCKPCLHRLFWKMQGLNLLLGWWGIKSVWFTLTALVDNTRQYWAARTLGRATESAPRLGPEERQRLRPLDGALRLRFAQGHPLEAIAGETARDTGLTPGQVILYCRELPVDPRRGGVAA